ncbi:MAG: hypothetical protein HOW97_02455 [Catenulispora sp.]|nr:hypothetical protein [Catenulispora sp.]
MSSGLMVTVAGEQVPLDECGWFQREKCGCIIAAVVAVVGSRVIATAEQAHKHMTPSAHTRAKEDREGCTWELMTMAHYRQHIGRRWECDQHRKDGAA